MSWKRKYYRCWIVQRKSDRRFVYEMRSIYMIWASQSDRSKAVVMHQIGSFLLIEVTEKIYSKCRSTCDSVSNDRGNDVRCACTPLIVSNISWSLISSSYLLSRWSSNYNIMYPARYFHTILRSTLRPTMKSSAKVIRLNSTRYVANFLRLPAWRGLG